MKLSKAQMRVLERMAAGETLFYLGGTYPQYFFTPMERNIKARTMDVLCEQGLVESYQILVTALGITKKAQIYPNYRLSAKGRAFMKGKESTP